MPRGVVLIMLFAAATVVLIGCGGVGGGPLAVEEVTMSASEGGPATTTFRPSDHTIYSDIRLNRAGTVKLIWTAVDTSAGQNIQVAEKEFTSPTGNTINAHVELPNDWPTGTYRLDIYLDGALAETVDYSVQ